MIKDYFMLTLKNVRKRGIRSWLTMLGIFLGIAAVVSLISLGSGLQKAIIGQFGTLDADKLMLENTGTGFGPPGSTAVKKLNSHDLELVKSVSEVEFAVPRLIRVASVEYNGVAKFRNVVSVPDDDAEFVAVINDFINADAESGRLIKEGDRGKVVLGNNFFKEDYGKDIFVGKTIKIQGREFEVVGILEKASSFIVNSFVLMPESDLQELLDIDDEIDLIVVQVTDEDKTETVAEEMARRLRKDRHLKVGEEDFSIQTPVQSLSAVNTILGIINIIVSGIAAISLFIGGIGIANTMYTSVLERTRDIGIMKAIGSKNQVIMLIFLMESGLLGLAGGIIGAAIGLGLAYLVSIAASSFLGGIDFAVSLSWPLIVGAVCFSLFIGILSGILPAIQASKMHPVEALRK
ncbi:MAG TPA: ABC transporter permease [Candidatus Nanoarchaeia archaeon]|nr:ABC transporter permease [Candidatus Nanoarchaeia archaeon]